MCEKNGNSYIERETNVKKEQSIRYILVILSKKKKKKK